LAWASWGPALAAARMLAGRWRLPFGPERLEQRGGLGVGDAVTASSQVASERATGQRFPRDGKLISDRPGGRQHGPQVLNICGRSAGPAPDRCGPLIWVCCIAGRGRVGG